MSAFILTVLMAILPACATEDSDNCQWNAAIQGNGIGTSFYTIQDQPHYYTIGGK